MRQYLCECTICGHQRNFGFDEPYPECGEVFVRRCDRCGDDKPFVRVMSRKARADAVRMEEEKALQERIRRKCADCGFACRFYMESVIIETPVGSWQFAYHDRLKTLRHESTVKINFETGDPAAMHYQFRDRKMTVDEVIEYIARHDGRIILSLWCI